MSVRARIGEELRALGIRASKGRGQNFFANLEWAREIIDFARLAPDAVVLEIGPGLGILTRELVARSSDLTVVEIDERLASRLAEAVPGLPTERIISGDVLSLSLSELRPGVRWSVVGNVPYSISTPLLKWLFNGSKCIDFASLLLQREFAERAGASPGSRSYGSLTVLRDLFADAELGPIVPASEFVPRPAVDSRLLRLTFRRRSLRCDQAAFEKVVRASFAHRRKTLRNNLLSLGDAAWVEAVLSRALLDGSRRAETLAFEEFESLAVASTEELGSNFS